MQQDDEYEDEEEAQVHDNTSIVKNSKVISPAKGKNVKASSKSPLPEKIKKEVILKKDEKKTSMTQLVDDE